MTDHEEILKQVYGVLEYFQTDDRIGYEVWGASKAIESMAAIEKVLLPPKKWTSLTNEDRRIIDNNYINELGSVEHFKAVEEKLKELNQ
jgi:hypothetical protein